MIRALPLLVLFAAAPALAQSADDAMTRMHHDHMTMSHAPAAATPTQPGEAAFAAIQEIVAILEADPKTDWSKVDIEALRRHLVDMNNVTLSADAKPEPVDGGVRFVVTGAGPVVDSIRRMTLAHAATMNGVGGWTFEAAPVDGGAALTVKVPPKDLPKLRALGFIGVMTRGMHHQMHHLMIAKGENPHP